MVAEAGLENLVLWLGTAAMLLGTLVFFWLGRSVAVYEQNFFVMAISITVIAAAAYLAMALGMGRVTVGGDEVLVARYIDWLLTTPLILVLLGILARARKSLVATLVGVDIFMIVAGLLGAIADTLYVSLVWWSVGSIAYIVILYLLLGALSDAASKQPDAVAGVYTTLRNLTVVLWSIYPVVWVLGGNAVGVLPAVVDGTVVVALDVFSKVGFGYILLSSHETLRVYGFYGAEREKVADDDAADDAMSA
ncbi:MAG: bacteriorhodopsin [Halobacteriales archaeon]